MSVSKPSFDVWGLDRGGPESRGLLASQPIWHRSSGASKKLRWRHLFEHYIKKLDNCSRHNLIEPHNTASNFPVLSQKSKSSFILISTIHVVPVFHEHNSERGESMLETVFSYVTLKWGAYFSDKIAFCLYDVFQFMIDICLFFSLKSFAWVSTRISVHLDWNICLCVLGKWRSWIFVRATSEEMIWRNCRLRFHN